MIAGAVSLAFGLPVIQPRQDVDGILDGLQRRRYLALAATFAVLLALPLAVV
jgi:hypothetical protein